MHGGSRATAVNTALFHARRRRHKTPQSGYSRQSAEAWHGQDASAVRLMKSSVLSADVRLAWLTRTRPHTSVELLAGHIKRPRHTSTSVSGVSSSSQPQQRHQYTTISSQTTIQPAWHSCSHCILCSFLCHWHQSKRLSLLFTGQH